MLIQPREAILKAKGGYAERLLLLQFVNKENPEGTPVA